MLVLRSTEKHQNGIMLLVGGMMPIVIPATFSTEKNQKTEAQCDENYKGDDEKVLPQLIWDWLLCKEGLLEKLL